MTHAACQPKPQSACGNAVTRKTTCHTFRNMWKYLSKEKKKKATKDSTENIFFIPGLLGKMYWTFKART